MRQEEFFRVVVINKRVSPHTDMRAWWCLVWAWLLNAERGPDQRKSRAR